MVDITKSDPDYSTSLQPTADGPARLGGVPHRDPWGVLRRNRFLIVASTAIVFGATAFFTLRMTPVYQASTSIRIDEKQSQLPALDILRLAAANELDTEMEMLRSRTLAANVVDSLDLQLQVTEPARELRAALFAQIDVPPDAVSGEYMLQKESNGHFRLVDAATDSTLGDVAPGGRVGVAGTTFQLAPGASQHDFIQFDVLAFEDAVDLLQSQTEVYRQEREASLVDVAYEGTDPLLVRDVANVLTARFIEARQNAQRTETRSTVNFLRAQIAKLSGELRSAEDTLRRFREKEQVVSLPDEATTGVSQLAEVRAQRNAIEAERAAMGRLVDDVRAAAARGGAAGSASYRDLVAFPTLLRNRTAVELLSSLVATEDRRAEMLTRRTERDPDVQALNARIRQVEEQIQAISLTYLKGLRDQVAALDATIAESERRLDRIPDREVRFARLDRNAKGLEAIVTLLQSRLKEAEIAEAVEDASVRLVDPAILPRWPVRPNVPLNLALAIVAGLALGLAVVFFREYRDKSVHTRRDVLIATGVPVLGLIPHTRRAGSWAARLRAPGSGLKRMAFRGRSSSRRRGTRRRIPTASDGRMLLLAGTDPQTPLAEANNGLATNLAFARPGTALTVLVVTSPLPGDGKTTSAINLAITLAKRGRKTLLVDADLRRGIVSSLLDIAREPGLATILLGGVEFRNAIQKVAVGGGAELHVLTTGALPKNPAMLLASARARTMLQSLKEEYDLIIIDTPPANIAADAALLGTNSDGVIIVARAGVTAAQALAFTMEQLQAVRAPVLGGILNDIDFERDATYDGAYRYSGQNSAYYTAYTARSEAAQ